MHFSDIENKQLLLHFENELPNKVEKVVILFIVNYVNSPSKISIHMITKLKFLILVKLCTSIYSQAIKNGTNSIACFSHQVPIIGKKIKPIKWTNFLYTARLPCIRINIHILMKGIRLLVRFFESIFLCSYKRPIIITCHMSS